jgi:hypothetical protein
MISSLSDEKKHNEPSRPTCLCRIDRSRISNPIHRDLRDKKVTFKSFFEFFFLGIVEHIANGNAHLVMKHM